MCELQEGGNIIKENELTGNHPQKDWKRLFAAFFFIGLIIAVCISPHFRVIYGLPLTMRVIEGETSFFETKFPLTVNLRHKSVGENLKNEQLFSIPIITALKSASLLEPVKAGHNATLQYKLFGVIPFRTVELDVLPAINLMPGGHSIGVVLQSQGIIVVGSSPVLSKEGRYFTPAKDAGLIVGDTLLSINGIKLKTDRQVAEIIDESGKIGRSINIVLKRDEKQQKINVTPVLCSDTKRYRIGLFVRDSAAGVGTLTFYEPGSGIYGALGHVITDNDTNKPINCEQGKIVSATVSGIQHGKRGHPGEKLGVFIEEDQLLGDIVKNTQFGIYGRLKAKLPNNAYPKPLPVASMSQLKLGAAQMLTVVDGQKIEKFDIEIEKINFQEFPESKGIVIKVTDMRLIEKTGGIVQGMSGSPIIQNGKIVGAVTHVFVHDPTLGYGCFMDWMLMDSGIIDKKVNLGRKLFGINTKPLRKSVFAEFRRGFAVYQ
jgi:stage IV sporulation protein B